MRRSGLSLVLAMGLAVPMAGQAQDKQDDVVVTARKPLNAEEARHLVHRISAATQGQIARFDAEVCPLVIGFTPEFEKLITARIRRVAKAVGADVAKPDCRGNVVLVATDDGGARLSRDCEPAGPTCSRGCSQSRYVASSRARAGAQLGGYGDRQRGRPARRTAQKRQPAGPADVGGENRVVHQPVEQADHRRVRGGGRFKRHFWQDGPATRRLRDDARSGADQAGRGCRWDRHDPDPVRFRHAATVGYRDGRRLSQGALCDAGQPAAQLSGQPDRQGVREATAPKP